MRVFPRRTKATPDDPYTTTKPPGLLLPKDIEEVHVSVTFTWDIPRAEKLVEAWGRHFPVQIGGPAMGTRGEEFVAGKYLKPGYVITSRGCPNKCWFCSAWKREGSVIRELPIVDGWNVQDNNLLACSESHIRKVFAMLKKQKTRASFTGGLEAKRLKPWHVELIHEINTNQVFFAYDTPDDLPPLIDASRMMEKMGVLKRRLCRCYVLIGFPGDTFEKAEHRFHQVLSLGMFPMAMLYRAETGIPNMEWRKYTRLWAHPALISALTKPRRTKGKKHGFFF